MAIPVVQPTTGTLGHAARQRVSQVAAEGDRWEAAGLSDAPLAPIHTDWRDADTMLSLDTFKRIGLMTWKHGTVKDFFPAWDADRTYQALVNDEVSIRYSGEHGGKSIFITSRLRPGSLSSHQDYREKGY
jgi:hypothetical protein